MYPARIDKVKDIINKTEIEMLGFLKFLSKKNKTSGNQSAA